MLLGCSVLPKVVDRLLDFAFFYAIVDGLSTPDDDDDDDQPSSFLPLGSQCCSLVLKAFDDCLFAAPGGMLKWRQNLKNELILIVLCAYITWRISMVLRDDFQTWVRALTNSESSLGELQTYAKEGKSLSFVTDLRSGWEGPWNYLLPRQKASSALKNGRKGSFEPEKFSADGIYPSSFRAAAIIEIHFVIRTASLQVTWKVRVLLLQGVMVTR